MHRSCPVAQLWTAARETTSLWGPDQLFGGSSDDTLDGGAGNNTLDGWFGPAPRSRVICSVWKLIGARTDRVCSSRGPTQ